MSKTIRGILIFVALVTIILFILALLALLDISVTKTGIGPHNAFFEFFDCGTDCIKAVAVISFVTSIGCIIAGGIFPKNKE